MRKEMQRRFSLLYRHFRNKKYGEPLPKKKTDNEDEEQLEEFKEDLALQSKI